MIVELSCVHRGNPIPLKVQALRGTNYCFKCHTLTGERPGLHSSFIAALCQMLLFISELTAQCALPSPADVHRSVCLLIPCMVMMCVSVQQRVGLYASCAGTTPLILCLRHSLLQAHIFSVTFTSSLASLLGWMSTSSITRAIHPLMTHMGLCIVFLYKFLRFCLRHLRLCSSRCSRWPETEMSAG